MFKRLKLYTVHIKPGASQPLENPVFVREGFSFFAFLFGIFWALFHRSYYFAAVIFVAYMGFAIAGKMGFLTEISAAITQLAMQVMIGFHAHDMWRDSLRKRGFITHDITSGETLMRAEQRYFDRVCVQGV